MEAQGSEGSLDHPRGAGERSSPLGLQPRWGSGRSELTSAGWGAGTPKAKGLGFARFACTRQHTVGLWLQHPCFFVEFTRTSSPCHRPEMPASYPSQELASTGGSWGMVGDPPRAAALQAGRPQMALEASAPRPQACHGSVGCLSLSCFHPSQVNPAPDPRSLGTQGCSVDTGH